MKIKIRIFLLISAAIVAIFLIVAAMQTKYHEKRSLNELRTRAKSVAEVAAISARIMILDGRSGKIGELIAGFEDKTRTQVPWIHKKSRESWMGTRRYSWNLIKMDMKC